ncbi:DNA polymerase II, small subunit [Methanobrevibacter arboriphilus JCM 13429 = DSM 1125]|uniref:DNA polymerase II small subunit n=1 Tax=Methanobrevibacter arboriphilus JCM 13429 = DSM 1125 TaxID=1300164 RepID=A0A1V6N3V5_METAZ|nr:DNA-directed DNA polymerase II small subunit [Methanobrevibacter arboriphilus]OQD59355.1 DNA polymerase II, small subunit [Methanobrevibacter arboriphilus JCM 13429 = DSM 1125]
MTTEVLFKFAKKNINLSPEAYYLINNLDDPLDFSSSLIVKLKSQEFSKEDLVSLKADIVEDFIKTLGLPIPNQNKDSNNPIPNSQKTLNNNENSKSNTNKLNTKLNTNKSNVNNLNTNKFNTKKFKTDKPDSKNFNLKSRSISPESQVQDFKADFDQIGSVEANSNNLKANSNDVNFNPKDNVEKNRFSPSECKRNLNPCNIDYNYKVIQDTSKKSYTSGEIGNLITYFKNRYSKLSKILSKRPELKAYQKISDLEEKATDLSLIVMVKEIRSTKNGHKIIVFDDDTGEISVLFHKDNHELFRESEKLVKDEVVGILAEKKGDLAIANKIIQPGVPRIAKKSMNFSAVFTSDIHIGSLTFLEDAFIRFTKWLNGDYGTEEQKSIGEDVKYLIVGGDIVDGIGVYPNQDKELSIKDISEQYEEAARLLGDIRSDIKIIISPGNHDASRVAEPQPAIPEKYAKSLYDLNNVEFVSNPAIVSLDGWNTLIYHGRGFDDIAITVKGFSHERNDLIMEELLNKRHLAPIYGERTPLASELEDHLVIDNVPDIFHTGHVHINTYKNYKGVHMINSGTFQTQTEFQKVHNILPTCAEVPILHRGVYKKLNFI